MSDAVIQAVTTAVIVAVSLTLFSLIYARRAGKHLPWAKVLAVAVGTGVVASLAALTVKTLLDQAL